MKKSIRTTIIISGVIIILLILFFSGIILKLNYPLNHILAGEPEKNCSVDFDCALRVTSCEECACGEAVNKNWRPFCPIPNNEKIYCKKCPEEGRDILIKCVENQCQKIGVKHE